MKFSKLAWFLGLLVAAIPCFAQMYTVTDLGTLGGSLSAAYGINGSGQVVGYSSKAGDTTFHAFRTAPNSPINPAADDLGTLGGSSSSAYGINDSGQVVGVSSNVGDSTSHAFRTAPNSAINPAADDLGTLGGTSSMAFAINNSGQVVGDSGGHGFRTAPNSPINPATDDLGTLGGGVHASAVNASGQVIGYCLVGKWTFRAFRTAPNSAINPATDDLGTLGGTSSIANGINTSGQVVGHSMRPDFAGHAFRTAPNSLIDPATDHLGTLGGTWSEGTSINASGQVVGSSSLTGDSVTHAFIYDSNFMYDLNNLIPVESGWELTNGVGINDGGQIVGNGTHNGSTRAFLLIPIYKTFVQQPVNAEGSSVFTARRGVIPVKFALTQYNSPTCALVPTKISVSRTAGGTLGTVDASTYSMAADSGSDFRIGGCQYIYNLAALSLGVGTYRVDISINGIMVGHAVFALK
jgi:probable HAF family extracellular repeat protein